MSPVHYAVGQNIQSGTIELAGKKTAKIFFPFVFSRKPAVTITLEDVGTLHVPYRTKISTTDFTVAFQTVYTGTVGWTAVAVG